MRVPKILVRQDFGKADNRVQRGTQLVGHVGEKFALQPPGGFECHVALAQRPLDPDRVGHVEIGQEHIAVGQRHRRHLQHRAVASGEPAARRRVCGDLGDDPLLHRRPIAAVIEKGAHLVDDLADMRLPGDIVLGQSPDLQVSRIVELQPAVATVHCNPLEQVVEGRAPHLGQGIARTLERQPVGHVLVDEGEPAERVRRYGQQQGAVVRQMHQLLLPMYQRGEEL